MKFFSSIYSSVFDFLYRGSDKRIANVDNIPHPPFWGEYDAQQAVLCPPVSISLKETVQAVSTQAPMVDEKYRRLFDRPNEMQSWQELFISALNSYLLYGACFLYVNRMRSGTIIEMFELPADEMKVVKEEGKVVFLRKPTLDKFDTNTVCYVRDFLGIGFEHVSRIKPCLLYTSPSPRDRQKSRMPSSA